MAQQATQSNVSNLPRCYIQRGKKEEAAPKSTRDLLARGWDLKQQEQALADERKEIETKLLKKHGTGCAVVLEGICRNTLGERITMTIKDVDALRKILGERFDDLVIVSEKHTPEKKLKDIVCDADHPLAAPVRKVLDVKVSEGATWRAA